MPSNISDIIYDKLAAQYGATDGTPSREHLADLLAEHRAAGYSTIGEAADTRAFAYWNALTFSTPITAYDAAVLADTPSGYWKLEDTSGLVAADSSGNLRHGAYEGAPTFSVAGPTAGATGVDFNGSNQDIDLKDDAAWSVASWTLEAWIKPDDFTTDGAIIAKNNGSGEFQWYAFTDGKHYAEVLNTVNGAYLDVTGQLLTAGAWNHVALTYNNATTTLTPYLNGVAGVPDSTPTGTKRGDTAVVMSAAVRSHATPMFFDGKMSRLAFYPSPLSAARLLAHKQALVP